MSLPIRLCLALCLALAGLAPAVAREDAPAVQVAAIVDFDSGEGQARLARAARADLDTLRAYFEAQTNNAFCGPASASIVLNALADERRHTQESVVAKGRKTRAQVLGEPMPFNGRTIRDGGYQLRQFDEMLRANGATTRLVVADEMVSDERLRHDLIDNLSRPGDYAIINYRRDLAGQPGGGHLSPLAAYDAATDSFLVLDVNPSVARWAWIPASALIRAMRSPDVAENRGYVTVSG
jgi:hypothetical protein